MGMKVTKRVRLDRVGGIWVTRRITRPDELFLHFAASFDVESDPWIIVYSPPNAAGVYPICQPGNCVPVVLRPDWRRYQK